MKKIQKSHSRILCRKFVCCKITLDIFSKKLDFIPAFPIDHIIFNAFYLMYFLKYTNVNFTWFPEMNSVLTPPWPTFRVPTLPPSTTTLEEN